MAGSMQSSLPLGDTAYGKPRSQWALIGARALHSKSALVGGAIVACLTVCALLAPILSTHDPFEQDLQQRLLPPSGGYLLGTDQYGRDTLSRLLYGSRITLSVGVSVVAIGVVAGCALGISSGYYGGWYDLILQRAIDVMLALPGLLLALVIVAVLGPGLGNVMIAVTVGWLPGFVRVVRGSTLAAAQEDYVLAARVVGAGGPRIAVRHILPNVLSPLIVTATLALGGAILDAAALGFLGLGAQPPSPEWGAMLARARNYMHQEAWLAIAPGLSISLAVLGFNLLGDGLRDALDPRWIR